MVKETGTPQGEVGIKGFLMICRMCEFKKCCKKYKHGKRCKGCPKKK